MKDARQLGCVFQNPEQPESSTILRKSPKVLGPIRRVRFTKATHRHANIRENICPSLGKIQVKVPLLRSPFALKFEDRSQEEIERQERCAHSKAWNLANNIYKFKENDKATFFSPSNEWCLPAPSVIKLEEREFVEDSGASMHMLSKKDLNSADLGRSTCMKMPNKRYMKIRAYKRSSDGKCQGIGPIRDSKASRRYTGCSLTWKTLPCR